MKIDIFTYLWRRQGLLALSLILLGNFFPMNLKGADTSADTKNGKNGNDFKVGLVLSGGGAKGIAHVGVIKALEDHNIPIDYVAGTSMGAIVGSLYTCGWSPEEMMKFFTSKDFGYWSTGKINPEYKYYYSTPEPTPEWVSVNLNFKDSTQSLTSQILPSHLINTLPMNIEFLNLYAPYSQQCGEDFNRLMVPLRTVCSDVYSKHKIVCSRGSLGDAVRASMSFPLVFKPIEMDGVLVYDGGIYDNFPVDVMEQDFNPDFIIGVSVSSPDKKPQPGNVYSQLEDMIIQNNNYSVPADKGIKIQVPVLNFGVLDFNQAEEIYRIGYETGMAMVDSVMKRCPARRALSEVTARRHAFASKTPNVEFSKIEVEGAKPGQARYLESLFHGPEKQQEVNMKEVENSYYRAVTDGKLKDLLPQYIPGPDNHNTLLLKANVKNPWNLGIGGWITSSTHSMLYVHAGYHTLSFNSLNLDLSGWIGQSYYAAMFSAKMALSGSVPSFVNFEAVVSRQKYFSDELLFYQDKTPTFITDSQEFFKAGYTMAVGRKGKFSATFGGGLVTDKYFPDNYADFANAHKDVTNYRSIAIEAKYEYNTLDNQMYPMSGKFFDSNLILDYEGARFLPQGDKRGTIWGKARPSFSAEVKWKQFFPVHQRFIIGGAAEGLMTIKSLNQNYTATLVHSAAFAPTPSTKNYFNIGFRNNNYLAAGIIPIWNPVGALQLRGDFYAYLPVRELKETAIGCHYDGWFRRAEFIGEVAAVYNFPFASLSVYGNYLSYPSRNWNFGISFGLFFQAPRFTR
ncbi:MAG: patatin-like phospholipase family protein [Muribaculaceae bacterium]|nr:patatin-like phospholipase family protein [Muribaculaceae bacterium]